MGKEREEQSSMAKTAIGRSAFLEYDTVISGKKYILGLPFPAQSFKNTWTFLSDENSKGVLIFLTTPFITNTPEFMLTNYFWKAPKDWGWLPGEPKVIRGLGLCPYPYLQGGERGWRLISITNGQ